MSPEEMKFTGTLEQQLKFQENLYQILEQDVPFICSTEYMFKQINNPDMYMEYIDNVASMCRFRGDAGSMYVVYPKNYVFKEVTDSEKGPSNDPDPDEPPPKYA